MTGFGEAELELILKAVHFAAYKHRDQRRKNPETSPYINHPIAVSETLWRVGGVRDVNVLVAGILHDTVEDTETTPDELEREFGSEIARIVAEVTDDKSLPKLQRKRLQVETASQKSEAARLVKLADKICNVTDVAECPPQEWSQKRRREYVEWAREVVDQIRGVNQALESAFDAARTRALAEL